MAQPGPAPQPDVDLQQRVAELEKINAEFLRAQQQLEQEFNQKRAKFKELYLAKEEGEVLWPNITKLHCQPKGMHFESASCSVEERVASLSLQLTASDNPLEGQL